MFLRGLFKGMAITLLGVATVYVIFFIAMAPKLPKNASGIKSFVTEMFNIKGTITRMQKKSGDYLDKKETAFALENDGMTDAEFKKAKAEINAASVPSVTVVGESDKETIARLQEEVQSLEKQNRRLILRVQQLEGKTTE